MDRHDLKDLLFMVAILLVCAIAIGSLFYWEWSECRNVGHGRLYCLVQIGK